MSKKEQFVIVPIKMVKDRSISIGAKVLYMTIKMYYPLAFPSIPKLMEHTGMSKRTVIRKIAELEKIGAVKVRRKQGESNLYVLNLYPGDKGNYDQIEDLVSQRTLTGAKRTTSLVQNKLLEVVPKELP